jgi:hypothetical protein
MSFVMDALAKWYTGKLGNRLARLGASQHRRRGSARREAATVDEDDAQGKGRPRTNRPGPGAMLQCPRMTCYARRCIASSAARCSCYKRAFRSRCAIACLWPPSDIPLIPPPFVVPSSPVRLAGLTYHDAISETGVYEKAISRLPAAVRLERQVRRMLSGGVERRREEDERTRSESRVYL